MAYQMVIIDDENENAVMIEPVPVQDLNYILITNGPNGTPKVSKVCEHLRLDEAHTIKQIYRETAEQVREKFKDYIGHVSTNKIMFVIDDEWEPTDKATGNSLWKIDLKKTTTMERTLTNYQYKMMLRAHWLEQWDPAHLFAALFSQMLRIDSMKGTVLNYTEEFQSAMAKTLGAHYLTPETQIPNIMTDEIDFKGLPVIEIQTTMEDAQKQSEEKSEKPEESVEEQTELKAVK